MPPKSVLFCTPDMDPARGIATLVLEHCESAIRTAGFTRAELGATLTGIPLYVARGYVERERSEAELGDGLTLPIISMEKSL